MHGGGVFVVSPATLKLSRDLFYFQPVAARSHDAHLAARDAITIARAGTPQFATDQHRPLRLQRLHHLRNSTLQPQRPAPAFLMTRQSHHDDKARDNETRADKSKDE